jgi:hypothetical protein
VAGYLLPPAGCGLAARPLLTPMPAAPLRPAVPPVSQACRSSDVALPASRGLNGRSAPLTEPLPGPVVPVSQRPGDHEVQRLGLFELGHGTHEAGGSREPMVKRV